MKFKFIGETDSILHLTKNNYYELISLERICNSYTNLFGRIKIFPDVMVLATFVNNFGELVDIPYTNLKCFNKNWRNNYGNRNRRIC